MEPNATLVEVRCLTHRLMSKSSGLSPSPQLFVAVTTVTTTLLPMGPRILAAVRSSVGADDGNSNR